MTHGLALTDGDRWPWLRRVAFVASNVLNDTRASCCVVACSALKRNYRDILRGVSARVYFVYLCVSPTCLHDRLARRNAHFMPKGLLQSQLDALEQPSVDEHDVFTVNVGKDDNMEMISDSVMNVVHGKV